MARLPFCFIHMFFLNNVRISLDLLPHFCHSSCEHSFIIQLSILNYNNIFGSLNFEVN